MSGGVLSALVIGCGARTGLPVDVDRAGGRVPASDAGLGSTDGGDLIDAFSDDRDFGAGTLCSLYGGPVDSCDAGSAAGPVQRCGGQFTVCAQEFDDGWWGCCVPNPPGGLADCYYGQVLDAGCQ